jgi:hypothetical protein
MKKILLFSFLAIGVCKAQHTTTKTQIGLDISMGNNAIFRQNILPSITLSKNKHVFFAGPGFYYNLPYNEYVPAYGAQAGYQFYPNGQTNRFNLFFEYDISYVSKTYRYNYYSGFYPNAELVKKAAKIRSFDNYLGFGFKLNIDKVFYLHTNVGFGVLMYREDSHLEFSNGSTYDYSDGTGIYYGRVSRFHSMWGSYTEVLHDRQLIGIFKVGLGINVCSLSGKTNDTFEKANTTLK